MTGDLLKVGRSYQLSFWNSLIPDEQHRNKVSRDHFEVRSSGSGFELSSNAASGTLLNGKRITERAALRFGDEIAIPTAPAASGRSSVENDVVAAFVWQKVTSLLPPAKAASMSLQTDLGG